MNPRERNYIILVYACCLLGGGLAGALAMTALLAMTQGVR